MVDDDEFVEGVEREARWEDEERSGWKSTEREEEREFSTAALYKQTHARAHSA